MKASAAIGGIRTIMANPRVLTRVFCLLCSVYCVLGATDASTLPRTSQVPLNQPDLARLFFVAFMHYNATQVNGGLQTKKEGLLEWAILSSLSAATPLTGVPPVSGNAADYSVKELFRSPFPNRECGD